MSAAAATRWSVTLQAEDDRDGLLAALASLVERNIAPEAVRWQVGEAPSQEDLFADDSAVLDLPPPTHPARWPDGFRNLASAAGCHADPQRFARLHALALRLQADRRAWADTLDPGRIELERMAQQVRRELHKMHAFVRFRPVEGEDDDGRPLTRHVAWFEPEHHLLRAAAPYFLRRFAAMHWAILTPRGSLRWDRRTLSHGPAVPRSEAPPADAGEQLWLAYYRSIFNPARLKIDMMRKEMPVRYWRHLPEAALIDGLIREAAPRAAAMLREEDHRAAPLARRMPSGCGASADRSDVDALQRIRIGLSACDRCAFARHATQPVPGEGSLQGDLMIVGEQPGDQEDLEGRPFTGPAGTLLREAIQRLGWPMDRIYLTNAVKHFKFELRGRRRIHKTAAEREQQACAEWLEAEIAAIRPRAIVALGATAAASLLGRGATTAQDEGRWFTRADGTPVLRVRHPSALLRASSIGLAPLTVQAWQAQLATATPWLPE